MAEYVREIVVTIEVDTNKSTYTERLTWNNGETREEFERRVVDMLRELVDPS